jgi:Domain of unknown function (DUF4345)
MRGFALTLKLISPVFILVAALHLIFGLQADAMLGGHVTFETALEPSLNSQNRFYGVAFAFYGVAMYLCAGDIRRYEPILKALLCVFFLAGVARVVSWVTHGAPALLVMLLMATELLLPPALLIWLGRSKNET